MNKTISVWLKVEDGKNKGKVGLQKRSKKNKTFPFVCQATWAGKVEIDESIGDAIKRECKEEMGSDFANKFDFSSLEIAGETNFLMKNEEWACYHYVGKIPENILKIVKIHNEAFPELVFINKNSDIFPISSGKDPKNNIVFFDDQYKIIKKVLDK